MHHPFSALPVVMQEMIALVSILRLHNSHLYWRLAIRVDERKRRHRRRI